MELNDKQIKRVDEIENATFELIKTFTEKYDMEWDYAVIGELADRIADYLVQIFGYRVHYPVVVYDADNDEEYVSEYYEPF